MKKILLKFNQAHYCFKRIEVLVGKKSFDILKVGSKIDLSRKDIFYVMFLCISVVVGTHIINDLILFLNIRLEHFQYF